MLDLAGVRVAHACCPIKGIILRKYLPALPLMHAGKNESTISAGVAEFSGRNLQKVKVFRLAVEEFSGKRKK